MRATCPGSQIILDLVTIEQFWIYSLCNFLHHVTFPPSTLSRNQTFSSWQRSEMSTLYSAHNVKKYLMPKISLLEELSTVSALFPRYPLELQRTRGQRGNANTGSLTRVRLFERRHVETVRQRNAKWQTGNEMKMGGTKKRKRPT
jgi:hypothetical protein